MEIQLLKYNLAKIFNKNNANKDLKKSVNGRNKPDIENIAVESGRH